LFCVAGGFAEAADKPLEFPPLDSAGRISGELVSAHFIHRTGQFRSANGDLMDFTMPPCATVKYLNAEADLRDVPLGTVLQFFLTKSSRGGFTRLATMHDQFTADATASVSYRLKEVKLDEGKLLTTRSGVSEATRVWRGDQQVKLDELAAGDELLFKPAGQPARCSDIWVGADTHKLATERDLQRGVETLPDGSLETEHPFARRRRENRRALSRGPLRV
jgi:hypothetical protein